MKTFTHAYIQMILPYPLGLQVHNLAWAFIYTLTVYMQAKNALESLHICQGSPQPLLLADALSTKKLMYRLICLFFF